MGPGGRAPEVPGRVYRVLGRREGVLGHGRVRGFSLDLGGLSGG